MGPVKMFAKARPADIHLALTPPEQPASSEPGTASLFGGPNFVPDEQKIFAVLRADEPTHIDELVERLLAELSSSQIFCSAVRASAERRCSHAPGEILVRVISRQDHFGIKSQSC